MLRMLRDVVHVVLVGNVYVANDVNVWHVEYVGQCVAHCVHASEVGHGQFCSASTKTDMPSICVDHILTVAFVSAKI